MSVARGGKSRCFETLPLIKMVWNCWIRSSRGCHVQNLHIVIHGPVHFLAAVNISFHWSCSHAVVAFGRKVVNFFFWTSKRGQQIDTNWSKEWSRLWLLFAPVWGNSSGNFGAIMGARIRKKESQKCDADRNLLAPAERGQGVAKAAETKRRALVKCRAAGHILYLRKGGIRPYTAS
jgi:hypothetical protein